MKIRAIDFYAQASRLRRCRFSWPSDASIMCRNVVHKPCAEPGCVTLAVFNQPGAGHGLYCGQHKPAGYVNVKV